MQILLHAAKRRSKSTGSFSPAPTDDVRNKNATPTKKDKGKLMESSLEARKRGILPGQGADGGGACVVRGLYNELCNCL